MQTLPKFRLWHIPTQRMYEVYALLLNFKKAYVTPLTLLIANELPETMQVDLSDDQSVLMQFTGMIDGHGQPIYEGDVLEAYYDETIISKGESPYYGRYAVISMWGSFGMYTGPPYEDYDPFAGFQDDNLDSYWVCGNVHQLCDWASISDEMGVRPDLMIPFGKDRITSVNLEA